MFCPNCGNHVGETDAFCGNCGCQFVQPAQTVYQQPVYQQPVYYQQPPAQEQPKKKENGMALAGLLLSIAGALQMIPFIGNVLGLIFGIIGLKKSKELEGAGKTMSVIGIVVSGFTLGSWLLSIVASVIISIVSGLDYFAMIAKFFNYFFEFMGATGTYMLCL